MKTASATNAIHPLVVLSVCLSLPHTAIGIPSLSLSLSVILILADTREEEKRTGKMKQKRKRITPGTKGEGGRGGRALGGREKGC